MSTIYMINGEKNVVGLFGLEVDGNQARGLCMTSRPAKGGSNEFFWAPQTGWKPLPEAQAAALAGKKVSDIAEIVNILNIA